MAGRAVKAWTKLVEMGLPVVTSSLFPAIMSGQLGLPKAMRAAGSDLFMASHPPRLPRTSLVSGGWKHTWRKCATTHKTRFYAGEKH